MLDCTSNLNVSLPTLPQIPIVSTYIDGGGVALNKLAWTPDGRRSAIGAADGRVHIIDVGAVSVRSRRNEKNNLIHAALCGFIRRFQLPRTTISPSSSGSSTRLLPPTDSVLNVRLVPFKINMVHKSQ